MSAGTTSENAWVERMASLVERKPIAVVRLDESATEHLIESRGRIREFTIARERGVLDGIRVGTLCLVETTDDSSPELRVGVVRAKQAVSTFESRIAVTRLMAVSPHSLHELGSLLRDGLPSLAPMTEAFVEGQVRLQSGRLSAGVVRALAGIPSNRRALRAVYDGMVRPTHYAGAAQLQQDAIRVALKVFGVDTEEPAVALEVVDGESTLAQVSLLEDAVIEHDAREVPGYNLLSSDLTGRAMFQRGTERLEVITANKRPLERVLGVDLIYLNAAMQTMVLVQYKMLDLEESEAKAEWVYRPDGQLREEVRRMEVFAAGEPQGPFEYRLNPEAFYLKFVKRDGRLREAPILLPLGHFKRVLDDPSLKGRRGGARVSYEALAGRYLRQEPFLDLIRAGYIGAYGSTTEHLTVLVDAILEGNRAVVAALHQRVDGSKPT